MTSLAHILIVDDETNIRLMLRTALETNGYAIEEALNGREALDTVAVHKPDVMILDLSMPEMDGFGVLDGLRGMRASQRPKVIVLTAYGSIPAAVKATRLGALDFLEKPVAPDEVREAVEAALAEPSPHEAEADAQAAKNDQLAGGYEAVLNRVRKALRLAKYADAESLLMKAADLGEKDAAYFNLLGVLYEAQRKWRLAKKFYGKSIAADGHYEAAQQNMRRIYELYQYGRSQNPVTLGDEIDMWIAKLPLKD
jgi:DNA-binding response OmpR family regulator